MNKILKNTLLACFILLVFGLKASASIVDTIITHSNSMHKDVKAVVISPDHYSKQKHYPVLYLLHGFSGNYADWILKAPGVAQLAEQYQMIIVCPDGNFASWYFDSPMSKEWMYETYVAKELVEQIDSKYSTIANRNGRAITGLSMGGHGAIYLAIRHQDTFGATGSMSGCVDLAPFSKNFGLSQVLGPLESNPQRWKEASVINMVNDLKPGALAIIFDCGYSDGFYPSNLAMHKKMVELKIPHDFTVRDGGHSWEYWANSIVYQALFFSRYFNKVHA